VTYHCVALQAGRLGEDRAYAEDCGGALPYVCQAPVARAATACAPCPTGSYAVPGASYCSACPLGTYAPHAGMAGCTTCGAWTPARMLASTFSPHAHRAGGGSIKCGGSLGRPQRNSYLTIAVLGVPVAVTASVFSYIAFLRLGAFAARKGAPLRGFNSRLRDREWWANVGTTCIAIFGSLATAFACAFLQPVRQHSNYSWPYKGRLSATNERNGCDPGRGERYFWTAFAAFVITALWCLLPLLNVALLVVGAPVRWHTVALRRRLRAVLEAERTRWVDEERARAALTRQPKDFVCTLCRARRAIALNEPCSHQFLCLECAHSFRESNGDVCNACRAPSTLVVLRQHLDPSVRGGAASVRSVHADNSVRGGRKLQALFDGLLGGGAASPDELWRAIAEAKRSRGRADRKFKERACAGCGLVKDLLVDVPCGHANLCADCANAEGSSSSMDGSGRGGSGRGGLERALSFGRAPRPALVVGVPRLRKHTCLRCSRPSTLAVPVKALNCSVCFDSVDASDLAALGACGHQLCTTCSVGYVRSALGDVAEHVRAGGLRCPLHYAGCASTVTLAVISRLVSRPLANLSEQDRSTILPLAPAEFERLERFFDEAALPVDERFYCAFKDCARLFAVEHRDALAKYAGLGADVAERRDSRARLEQVQSIIAAPLRRIRRNQNTRVHPDQPDANADPFPDVDLTDEAKAGEARNVCLEGPEEKALRQLFSSCTPFAHCPYCARPSCVRCKTAAHPAVACADTQDEAKLTFAFVDATSKPCPQCALRVTHSHGHACHHIRPGSGCPNCATHFCESASPVPLVSVTGPRRLASKRERPAFGSPRFSRFLCRLPLPAARHFGRGVRLPSFLPERVRGAVRGAVSFPARLAVRLHLLPALPAGRALRAVRRRMRRLPRRRAAGARHARGRGLLESQAARGQAKSLRRLTRQWPKVYDVGGRPKGLRHLRPHRSS